MRIMTMLLSTLALGIAGIGAWMIMGPELPSVLSGGDAGQEKAKRKKDKWREAPYVILAPAETLPEKKSSLPPAPPAPSRPEAASALVASSPAPRPASQVTALAPKPPQPSTPSAPAATSSIAKQALETVIGPQAAPRPVTKAEPQQVAKTAAPAAPAPVTQEMAEETAEEKKKFQLPYETETESRAKALEKQQSLLAKEQVRFRRAVPQSSGTLKSDTMTIALAGLDALGADAQCNYASGKSWACGRWGKYALRRLIRSRSVVCDVIEQVSETEVTARCNVAGVDINKWVVRRGWGQPSGGGVEKYSDALKAAKNEKLGQWSNEQNAKQN